MIATAIAGIVDSTRTSSKYCVSSLWLSGSPEIAFTEKTNRIEKAKPFYKKKYFYQLYTGKLKDNESVYNSSVTAHQRGVSSFLAGGFIFEDKRIREKIKDISLSNDIEFNESQRDRVEENLETIKDVFAIKENITSKCTLSFDLKDTESGAKPTNIQVKSCPNKELFLAGSIENLQRWLYSNVKKIAQKKGSSTTGLEVTFNYSF